MLSKNLMGTMGDFLLAEQKEGVTLTCSEIYKYCTKHYTILYNYI